MTAKMNAITEPCFCMRPSAELVEADADVDAGALPEVEGDTTVLEPAALKTLR